MGGFSRALDSETPAALRAFDHAVLGWGGTLLCGAGVAANVFLIFLLARLNQRVVYNIVVSVADILLLAVWGTYYSLTYLVDLLKGSSVKREDFNSYLEPIADLVQTVNVWLLVALAGDAFVGVARGGVAKGSTVNGCAAKGATANGDTANGGTVRGGERCRAGSGARVAVTVAAVIIAAIVINLPKVLYFNIKVPSAMSWSAPKNVTQIPLYDHDLYIWIYEYVLNYLFRFILPFIVLAIVTLRTNLALKNGQQRQTPSIRLDLMNIGAVLFSLLCYAPFLVNYVIYAAWMLNDSEAAAAAITGDMGVRKFNTFCYLFIMAASSLKLFVYLAFNPAICCPRRQLFSSSIDRYGRYTGTNGYRNYSFRY